jgi:hypothetical protein
MKMVQRNMKATVMKLKLQAVMLMAMELARLKEAAVEMDKAGFVLHLLLMRLQGNVKDTNSLKLMLSVKLRAGWTIWQKVLAMAMQVEPGRARFLVLVVSMLAVLGAP